MNRKTSLPEPDSFFQALETEEKYHVNGHLISVLKEIIGHHMGDTPLDRMRKKRFIRQTPPSIHLAIDSLNELAVSISTLESHYKSILAPSGHRLEDRVGIEQLTKNHVLNLKKLYKKQKVTLTNITNLFLRISRNHLEDLKRKK